MQVCAHKSDCAVSLRVALRTLRERAVKLAFHLAMRKFGSLGVFAFVTVVAGPLIALWRLRIEAGRLFL